jgi:AAA ATPase domain
MSGRGSGGGDRSLAGHGFVGADDPAVRIAVVGGGGRRRPPPPTGLRAADTAGPTGVKGWLRGSVKEDDGAMEMIGQAPHEGATGLLERSRELAALGGSLAEVSDSRRGRMVVIGGEAGIGKTALLRSFCDDLGKAVRVLWASCDPLFTPRPLGPLLDVARVTDGELRTQVERGGTPHDVAAAVMNELASRHRPCWYSRTPIGPTRQRLT